MTSYSLRRGGEPTLDALDRLGQAGVPLDTEAWLHACALVAADPAKAEKYGKYDWPALILSTTPEGRLHPKWQVKGATPRIYPNPNMQGIPKGPMREAVRADGSLMVCADWSASHVRIVADLSGDAALIDDIISGDPYGAVCVQLGLDPTSDRQAVKPAVLALLNGQGMRSRWERLPYHAHRLPAVMRSRWPVAMNYLDNIIAEARSHDGKLRTPAGTVVRVPAAKLYAAPAYWLQTIEADALLRAIRALHELEDAGHPLQLVMTVHDEIVVECHDPGRVQLVAALVGDAMSTATGFRCDLRAGAADVTFGSSWGQQDNTSGSVRPLPLLPAEVVIKRPVPEAPWAHLNESECATGCMAAAYGRTREIRQDWYEAGVATRGRGCLARSLHAASPDEFVSWGMRCRRTDCVYCGPYQHALVEQAILGMPLVSPDGEVIGRPLGQRPLFHYRLAGPELPAFLIAWRKATRKDRIPSTTQGEDRRNPILSPEAPEAHGYVVVEVPKSGEVIVLTTVERVYERPSKPQPTVPLSAEIIVQAALEEALTPTVLPDGTVEVAGGISSSNNLHLDPGAIREASKGSIWRRILGPKGAAPSVVADRLRRLVRMACPMKDDEGIIESVRLYMSSVKGSFARLVACLEGGLDDAEVEVRIQHYLDSCQVAPVSPAPPEDLVQLKEALALLDED